MRAMILDQPGVPLVLRNIPVPRPEAGQVLLRGRACGVCRTDLHILLSKPTRRSMLFGRVGFTGAPC